MPGGLKAWVVGDWPALWRLQRRLPPDYGYCSVAGAGSAYPAFAAHILEHVDAHRRGAAFGSILLAVDTGIGTGSILLGVVVEHLGYRAAFTFGGLMALGAIPYFRFAEKRLGN
jgi:MFS family permease